MQQRRLRLGDILDDYCPRERRITNHAVVAMIEDEVKQTRCTDVRRGPRIQSGEGPAAAPKAARRRSAANLPEGMLRPRAAAEDCRADGRRTPRPTS